MCGIAGWLDFQRDLRTQASTVRAMGDTLRCRGPDDEGLWLGEHLGFAQRRLVVIDPVGGRQPMVRRRGGGRFVINYNGELYNTGELRRDLRARGWDFRGHSDTEVLLTAYMQWGPACLDRLNGIFAFAVWDEHAERLLLARDRLGVKPLFYTWRGSSLLFASELKALLAHPDVPAEVDEEGLAEVFALGPGRTPGHGVFRGVQELKAGHVMLVDRRGARSRAYWRLVSGPHRDDLTVTTETVRALLEDAARRQLVSDVPIGALLSGGLDSSALTAFAAAAVAEAGRGPLRTFSVEYRDNRRFFRPNDFQPDADAPWVRRVSSALGTAHREVVVDNADLADHLDRAMRARDLPGMADVDASLYLFCREIKKEASVALSGECADEVFGGYPWLYRRAALEADTFPWSLRLDARLRFLAPDLVSRLRPVEYVRGRYEEALKEVPRLEGESAAEARVREVNYLNLTRWMPVLLDRKDRMSMAVGLEVRVPFCDHRLVEYVWNVPWAMKNKGGREKGLLRLALQGVLPPDVIARKKSPFPKTHNPAYLDAVRARLLTVLDDPTSPLRPLVRVDALRDFARGEAQAMELPWFGQLMSGPQLLAYMLQVDAWLRAYRVRIR